MAWFKRMRRKLRNYTSAGDYAGSHGGGSSSGSGSHAKADLGIQHARTRDTTTPTS